MNEVRVCPSRGANEAREQSWEQQSQPWPPAQIAEHAVAVGDPVVPILLRPDHFDADSSLANVLDRVCDEPTGSIAGMARVRRRQDGDAHQLSTRKTAYPSEPSVSCVSRGALQAAQNDGSGDTCRKSCM